MQNLKDPSSLGTSRGELRQGLVDSSITHRVNIDYASFSRASFMVIGVGRGPSLLVLGRECGVLPLVPVQLPCRTHWGTPLKHAVSGGAAIQKQEVLSPPAFVALRNGLYLLCPCQFWHCTNQAPLAPVTPSKD